MSNNITKPSWDTITSQVQWIYRKMHKAEYVPQVIVGLTRGGLIPATILSHISQTPMIAAEYSSKIGRGDSTNRVNNLPILKEKKLLIIDDIADSGHTLNEVVDFYTSLGHEVSTAVLIYKESSVVKPTFYATSVEADSPFIDFPWECATPQWVEDLQR